MPRTQITYERVPGTIVQIDGDGAHGAHGVLSDSVTGMAFPAGETPEPTGTPITSQPTLHVCWHKDANGNGWAQFMLRCDPEYLHQILLTGNGEPVELYTDILTRSECNAAVRATRSARDQAYGRDE